LSASTAAPGFSVACIGGINLDRKVHSLIPLRPGTSNPVTSTETSGGVARNVAEGLVRLGVPAALFSIVGNDSTGQILVRELADLGVDVAGVRVSDRHPTSRYTAVLGPGGSLAFGLSEMAITEELGPAWCAEIAPALAGHSHWLLDANLSAQALEILLRGEARQALVAVDPVSTAKASRLLPVLDVIDLVFPDREEASVLSGMATETSGQIPAAARRIRSRGVGTVVISLGEEGIYVEEPLGGRFLPPIPTQNMVEVTGAGDALITGFLYGLFKGGSSHPAINPLRHALAAASLALESHRTVPEHLSPERLAERMAAGP
jgi:pseudouridine kinase